MVSFGTQNASRAWVKASSGQGFEGEKDSYIASAVLLLEPMKQAGEPPPAGPGCPSRMMGVTLFGGESERLRAVRWIFIHVLGKLTSLVVTTSASTRPSAVLGPPPKKWRSPPAARFRDVRSTHIAPALATLT